MASEALLVGPASVDRYLATDEHLPGGGALNMAYHWTRRGVPCELVSRVSTDDRATFERFFEVNDIAHTNSMFVDGPSCSIDIRFDADRQPRMDNFVEGVWGDFDFGVAEAAAIRGGARTHLVLVDAVDRALHRLVGATDLADRSELRLTADFLSFRHFTPERFDRTFEYLELGVIGWPGAPEDPLVGDLAARTEEFANVLVLTFGSHGVRVIDGRPGGSDRWFDVAARPVTGTTVGCGDAFSAAFLAEWHRSDDVIAAVRAGNELGADATTWRRALPDEAFDRG